MEEVSIVTVCTFAGHREVYQANISEALDQALAEIIENDNSIRFLVGGMGEFDKMCASAVRRAKRKYPNTEIRLELVLPYLTNDINENKSFYEMSYDNIIVPFELAGVHYKSVITKRNRWLVDNSDWLIAFVYRDFGEAYTTLRYAEKKGLQIVNLAKQI